MRENESKDIQARVVVTIRGVLVQNEKEALYSGSAKGHPRRLRSGKPNRQEDGKMRRQVDKSYRKKRAQEGQQAKYRHSCIIGVHTRAKDTSCATIEEKTALLTKKANQVDFYKVWIVDSGVGNRMTGDKEKPHNKTEYKGGRVIVTADNTKLPIKHIGDSEIMPHLNPHPVQLQNVMHVGGMKKNIFFHVTTHYYEKLHIIYPTRYEGVSGYENSWNANHGRRKCGVHLCRIS
ncbi:hypothetical protein ACH5RR_041107 [Cinchona calisaya]|uniref:Retrovirus-related Pol polyprotein from transposon TNT 1-94-like beta-barrel domain-containing protein n=1 Tax=Cinchona calisaya TaxID=153742 RepID=A0ABD2XWK9_9GENT